MPLLQVTYDVPEEVWANLVSGAASRFGSVVRGSQHITSHLTEVSSELISGASGDALKQGTRVSRAGNRNYTGPILIGIGVVAASVFTTYLITKKVTEKSTRNEPSAQQTSEIEGAQPEVVSTYNEALLAYLEAMRSGTMTADLVSHLSAVLDEVQVGAKDGIITIKFSSKQSDSLKDLMTIYTHKLAEANSFDASAIDAPAGDERCPIAEVRHHLRIQEQMFKKAA